MKDYLPSDWRVDNILLPESNQSSNTDSGPSEGEDHEMGDIDLGDGETGMDAIDTGADDTLNMRSMTEEPGIDEDNKPNTDGGFESDVDTDDEPTKDDEHTQITTAERGSQDRSLENDLARPESYFEDNTNPKDADVSDAGLSSSTDARHLAHDEPGLEPNEESLSFGDRCVRGFNRT